MIPEIQKILERVWDVAASGGGRLPSPKWADDSYVEQCGELTEEEKKDSFLSDAATEISDLIYKVRQS